MPFELSHDRRSITGRDLLSDLQRVATQQSEQNVKQRTYQRFGKYGATTVIRRFLTLNAAIEAAGLVKCVVRNVPDEDLFALDRLVHNAHRIEMRGDSMRKNRSKGNSQA